MENEASLRTIDLSECDREPIAHLGLIQPHGYLVACNESGDVTHASENLQQLFEIGARDALGQPIAMVLEPESVHLVERMRRLVPGQAHHEFWGRASERYSLWIHKRDSHTIFEWEQLPEGADESEQVAEPFLADGLAELRAAPHIYRQAQLASELVARSTGFDRVMVYRFLPDGCGEVIAEVRGPRAEPFLGLRYPASDIPPQARALYVENLLRVLVDVYGTPVSLLSRPADSAPLDLSSSVLRAPSPFHIEYLKNMKAGATATASLICEGSLWGLIACHHDRRKQMTAAERSALAEIAQTLSISVKNGVSRARQLSQARVFERRERLEASIPEPASALNAILFGPQRLRSLLRGCGTAVWTGAGQLRMGDSPSQQEVEMYAARLLAGSEDIVALDSRAAIADLLGAAPDYPLLAGLLAIVVSREPALVLFAFRQELIQEIAWGGDVNRPVLRNEQTGALMPRRSFAVYKQSVLGVAASWVEEDLAIAHMVREVIGGIAPTAERISQLIRAGFSGMRELVTAESPAQQSLLDAIGNGVSLLFRSDSGAPTLRCANQALLDLAETFSTNEMAPPDANHLLASIGLPEDLLTKCEAEPQQVVIPTTREGLRNFLVERKLALGFTDRSGTISLSALLFTDITREERARETMRASTKSAEHLAFLKSSFLANMSHELRTPMNGVLGMVQLLQTTRIDPEQEHYLDVLRRSGELMLNVLNDILDFSKIEAGRVEFEKAPFDLAQVVEGAVDLLRPLAEGKSIALSAVFDSPPPLLYFGDSFRLRQVLLNIVGNAVKFTSSGGVVIRVHCEAPNQTSPPVVISITDTGIGIPQEQLAFVFDKFRQADASTTRRHGGTGLGLAISRELISLMGGDISLTSAVGVGSTFRVVIPLPRSSNPYRAAAQGVSPAHDVPSKPLAPGAGRRILVAEDDETNQIVIRGMLRKKGFEVVTVASGLLALACISDQTFDLILMDCQMPDVDGYETTARIRAMEGPRMHTPIVALTASALPQDRQRCLDAGMDDYLAKPVNMGTLWETLRKWNCLPSEPSTGASAPTHKTS